MRTLTDKQIGAGSHICPYLGSTDGPGLPFDRPSRRNVCCAQSVRRRKGLRLTRTPYAHLPRAQQAEFCLGPYTRCVHFERKNHAPDGASSERRTTHTRSRNHRRHAPKTGKLHRNLLARLRAPRFRNLRRAAAIGVASVASALALTLFFSAQPSKWVEYVYFTILRNDIKAFGLSHRGQEDKAHSAGLVTGGNLRALKNLSGSQVERLKESGLGRGLTDAQKAKLRQKFRRR